MKLKANNKAVKKTAPKPTEKNISKTKPKTTSRTQKLKK
jgi:hypothetical protein